MAAPDSIAQSLGFLSPMERASNDYSRILETLKLGQQQQVTNAHVADLGFNMPVYMGLQAASGFPGQGKPMLPDLNQAATPDSDLPSIMGQLPNGSMQGNSGTPPDGSALPKDSDRYLAAARYYQSKGDANRAMTAAQLYNKALIAEDKQRRQDEEQANKTRKEGLDAGKLEREKADAGNAVPADRFTVREPNGWEATYQYDRDKDGVIINPKNPRLLGRGPVSQTNINQNEDFTKEQTGKESIDFANQADGYDNFLNSAEKIHGLVKAGALTGKPADIVTTLDNVFSGVGQTLGVAKAAGKISADAADYLDRPGGSTFEQVSALTHMGQSQYAELIYNMASGMSKSANITKKDLVLAEQTLGSSISDPKKALAVIDQYSAGLLPKLENKYKYDPNPKAKENNKRLLETFRTRYEEYKHQRDLESALAKY